MSTQSKFKKLVSPGFKASPLPACFGNILSCQDGTVALIFALTSILVVGVVGGAVDFGRWYQTRSQLQSTMDAAVLAGGRVLQTTKNEGEAIAAAQAYYLNMKSPNVRVGTPAFSIEQAGTVVRGTVDSQITTPFLNAMRISSLPLYIRAEAVLAAGGNSQTNVEVSMMLDVTGSMSGQKIADMKTAAKDLIDIVVWDDQSQYTSKIALAPFSRRVNVDGYMKEVSNLQERAFRGTRYMPITCVTERVGDAEFTDDKPEGSWRWVGAYSGDSGTTAINNQANYSADGSCNDPSAAEAILPLTSDRTALKSKIDSFTAGGTTAGALGTAWAWYLISPNWQTVWRGQNRPGSYADLTTLGDNGQPLLKKIVVLMTDGIYNTYGGVQYGDSSAMATTISEKAVQLCQNMKAAGIKVYTVGFQLGGSTLAINTLKSCASREPSDPVDQPSYFYSASTGEQLRQAFREIALQIATLRVKS